MSIVPTNFYSIQPNSASIDDDIATLKTQGSDFIGSTAQYGNPHEQ